MLGGFGVGGTVRHLADGAVAAVCAVSVIRPSRELVGLDIVAVACLALLIVIAGIQIQVRLTGVVMLVVDRNGAGSLFIAAGDCDNCRALCLSGHLAGAVNCCHAGIAALPVQAARCVDRLLHGGELIGRIKIQIYLCRGNGNTGKLNDGSFSHGDIEAGGLRKRSDIGFAFLDGNQLQSGACRCGMSRFRLDLAVLQRNVIVARLIRSTVGSDLDNAPFQMIAAVLGQQLRKIGGKLRLVIFAQGNIRVCVYILKPQSIGHSGIIVYNHIPCAVGA